MFQNRGFGEATHTHTHTYTLQSPASLLHTTDPFTYQAPCSTLMPANNLVITRTQRTPGLGGGDPVAGLCCLQDSLWLSRKLRRPGQGYDSASLIPSLGNPLC